MVQEAIPQARGSRQSASDAIDNARLMHHKDTQVCYATTGLVGGESWALESDTLWEKLRAHSSKFSGAVPRGSWWRPTGGAAWLGVCTRPSALYSPCREPGVGPFAIPKGTPSLIVSHSSVSRVAFD